MNVIVDMCYSLRCNKGGDRKAVLFVWACRMVKRVRRGLCADRCASWGAAQRVSSGRGLSSASPDPQDTHRRRKRCGDEDIAVFDKLKQMTGGKLLWLRNNVATILCNCLENFGFIYLAFLGVYTAGQCFEIAIATSVIEIIAAVCDTPFAYIGRRAAKMRE